jgi:macrolide transport system ATP-binding/permease protein
MIDIKANNISFSYKSKGVNVPVLRGLSLEVKKGEMVAIKGPSGSGKSTLLYVLGGLLKQDAGTVEIQGTRIDRLTPLKLAKLRNDNLGFVFQQYHLLPRSTVLDNVLLPYNYPSECSSKKFDQHKKADELLKYLGLEDHYHHRPNQLSGGQQQRVAIGRALATGAEIILADEPTGNLDSKTTEQILDLFDNLNREGRTIVMITHEEQVANRCSRVLHFQDGQIIKEESRSQASEEQIEKSSSSEGPDSTRKKITLPKQMLKLLPLAFTNLLYHKARSLLTMLGIIVGVAAVCATVTLGNFTKEKIIDSYTTMGVNTMRFRGYPNWAYKATDQNPLSFQHFNWNKDILPLRGIFPMIKRISPVLRHWDATVTFGGRSLEKEGTLYGINEEGLELLGTEFVAGKTFNQFQVDQRTPVCVIGFEIAKKLFLTESPIGSVIHIILRDSSFACTVLGVLKHKPSNREWIENDKHVYIPHTYFSSVAEHQWARQIHQVAIELTQGSDLVKVGNGIKALFKSKYGTSGRFWIGHDQVMLTQMKKFLNLFTILLICIALISLIVGGIGITNMMLVSVSERYREIGIRKVVGATSRSIRFQFLLESLLLCTLAGIIGILSGVITYQAAIYAASVLIKKLEFEFILNWGAILLSIIAIFIVGIASGLVPAIKAEKLQVIEALRSD